MPVAAIKKPTPTAELVDLILSVDELLAPPPEDGAACVEVSTEDWADLVRLSLELKAAQ